MFFLQEKVFLIPLEFLSTIQPKKQVPAVDNNCDNPDCPC